MKRKPPHKRWLIYDGLGVRIEEKNIREATTETLATKYRKRYVFPTEGGWSLSRHAIAFIEVNLAKGSNILEFGSGEGTKELLQAGFRLMSGEDN